MKNYKSNLLFISKCLTIEICKENRFEVENCLKDNLIDWELFVKISSFQKVLITTYCIFQRSNLLNYLPNDLITYLKNIADINRKRNQKILEQCKEINSFANKNSFSIIFMKGCAHLLDGVYNDIGERLVGDIDILIKESDSAKFVQELIKSGYDYVSNYRPAPNHRHLARMVCKNKIAALEVHTSLTNYKHTANFNFNKISDELKLSKTHNTMSKKDQLIMSVVDNFINDYGYRIKYISLKNAYDILLLSKGLNILKLTKDYRNFRKYLNAYFKIIETLFFNGNYYNLEYSIKDKIYVKSFLRIFFNFNHLKKRTKIYRSIIRFEHRFLLLKNLFVSHQHRAWFKTRFINKFLKS